MKRILFLTHVGNPGGAELQMIKMCQSLEGRAEVLCLQDGLLPGMLQREGITVSILSMPVKIATFRREDGIIRIAEAVPSCISILRRLGEKMRDFDVTICMSQKSFILASLALPFSRRPIIWFMNDILSPAHFNRVLIRIMVVLSRMTAKHVVLNSQASLDAWIKSGGREKNISIIYPGTDIKAFDRALEDKESIRSIREKLAPQGMPLIGIFGRISSWKGQDVFLKALSRIEGAYGVIAGDAQFGEEIYADHLKALVKELEIEDRVIFTGHIGEIAKTMAACNIIVHCSTLPEPFGIVTVEAMAAGKPVIASAAGGSLEIIQKDVTGQLTPMGDDKALADAILKYLGDPEWAAELARKGRIRAEEDFSNSIQIEKFLQILTNSLQIKDMKKPPIIFLSPVSYFKGGAERSLFDLLENPDITPVVVAPEHGPILEKARALDMKCHILPFGDINNVHRPFSFIKSMRALRSLGRAAQDLKRICKENKCHIVHSNGLKAHVINCAARWSGGGKAIIHIRDIPYTRSEKAVWHILYFMCDRMVLVSRACWPGEKLPRKCVVVHNGTPVISSAMEARQLSFHEKEIRLGFIGRIHPAKGLHLVLDWLAAARGKGSNVRLSVRGSFSSDAPHYEDEIRVQIEKLNLTSYVEFLGHLDDPEKVYKDIDIVVVPSETPDPLPRSVMESMARGIPVIGYPAGGIFEMIEHGDTGFLASNGEEFYTALQTLLSSPEKIAGMKEKAYKKILSEFTIENLHNEMNRVYYSISGKT
jgi:glycosyltransferase involved in cell wall biosynthesis